MPPSSTLTFGIPCLCQIQMFIGATEFDQNLCGWKRKQRSCDGMFDDSKCEKQSLEICYAYDDVLEYVCQPCDSE